MIPKDCPIEECPVKDCPVKDFLNCPIPQQYKFVKRTATAAQICGSISAGIGFGTMVYYLFGGVPKMALMTAIMFFVGGLAIVLLGASIKKVKWIR